MSVFREVRVHAAHPDFRMGDCPLKFTLSYEGALTTGGAKAEKKHARRREFHNQLKRLWQVHPILSKWHLPIDQHYIAPAQDVIRAKYAKFGSFEFVPLVTKDLCVETALNFHILRPSNFKGQNADPDNIVKILVDSLKMPQDAGELPAQTVACEEEKPFFILMQDDGLVSKITSVTDELLQPVLGKNTIDRSDTRVLIEVYIRPNFPNNANLIFFSDDFEVWSNRWTEGVFDNIRGWSNAELRARTTQCILRMRVTASNFRMQRTASMFDRDEHFLDETAKDIISRADEQWAIWSGGLQPVARALLEELQRRVYGEPPYPSQYRLTAIQDGMLAGVDPIGEAAAALESLIRQLP